MLIIHIVHSEGYKKSKKKKLKLYTQDYWPTQPKFILILLEHEVTKSITTPPPPPERDASPLQGYPLPWYSFILLGGEAM